MYGRTHLPPSLPSARISNRSLRFIKQWARFPETHSMVWFCMLGRSARYT